MNAIDYYNLGNIYASNEFTDEAIVVLNKAIELDPNFPDPHNLLGQIYADRGLRKEAIKELRVALKLNPDFQVAKYTLEFIQSMEFR